MSGQPGNYTKLYPYILSPRKAKCTCAATTQATIPSTLGGFCSKQVMVFPHGIVSKYDVPELQDYVKRRQIFTGQTCDFTSRGTLRWGTQFLTTPKSSIPMLDQERDKMYRQERKPAVRVSYPQVKKISVKAVTANLNERPLTAPSKCTTETPRTPKEIPKAKRISQTVVVEKKKKLNERQRVEKQEIKIENGVIMIENGRIIELNDKSHKPKSKSQRSNSYSELKSTQKTVSLLDEAMIRLSDAKMNLEKEINSEAKTTKTRQKESEFFEQNVKTEFLDLFNKVRKKREKKEKKSKKKIYEKKGKTKYMDNTASYSMKIGK